MKYGVQHHTYKFISIVLAIDKFDDKMKILESGKRIENAIDSFEQ